MIFGGILLAAGIFAAPIDREILAVLGIMDAILGLILCLSPPDEGSESSHSKTSTLGKRALHYLDKY